MEVYIQRCIAATQYLHVFHNTEHQSLFACVLLPLRLHLLIFINKYKQPPLSSKICNVTKSCHCIKPHAIGTVDMMVYCIIFSLRLLYNFESMIYAYCHFLLPSEIIYYLICSRFSNIISRTKCSNFKQLSWECWSSFTHCQRQSNNKCQNLYSTGTTHKKPQISAKDTATIKMIYHPHQAHDRD